MTPETAEWAGGWADGLLTVSAQPEQQQKVVDAFRPNGAFTSICADDFTNTMTGIAQQMVGQ